MKTFKSFLLLSESVYGKEGDNIFFKNPIVSEVNLLFSKKRIGSVVSTSIYSGDYYIRGLIEVESGDLYVWSGNSIIHAKGSRHLNRFGADKFPIYWDHLFLGPKKGRPEYLPIIITDGLKMYMAESFRSDDFTESEFLTNKEFTESIMVKAISKNKWIHKYVTAPW